MTKAVPLESFDDWGGLLPQKLHPLVVLTLLKIVSTDKGIISGWSCDIGGDCDRIKDDCVCIDLKHWVSSLHSSFQEILLQIAALLDNDLLDLGSAHGCYNHHEIGVHIALLCCGIKFLKQMITTDFLLTIDILL